jgi:hypothetical protein
MPVILAAWEAGIRRMAVPGQQGQIVYEAHFQNNQSKMDWRCGSRSRALALQVQSPEFKAQSQKKNFLKNHSISIRHFGYTKTISDLRRL